MFRSRTWGFYNRVMFFFVVRSMVRRALLVDASWLLMAGWLADANPFTLNILWQTWSHNRKEMCDSMPCPCPVIVVAVVWTWSGAAKTIHSTTKSTMVMVSLKLLFFIFNSWSWGRSSSYVCSYAHKQKHCGRVYLHHISPEKVHFTACNPNWWLWVEGGAGGG